MIQSQKRNVVDARDVSYCYPGYSESVFEKITFAIPEGSRVVVLGENGAGKSTLLQLINGSHKSPTGSLSVLNQDAFEDTTLRQRVKYLSSALPGYLQHMKSLYKVKDIVQRHSFFHDKVYSLLRSFDLPEDMRIEALSNGQLRKLQIVMHVIQPFALLLVDECTRDVDVVGRKVFLDVLMRSSEGSLFEEHANSTVLYATHILDDMQQWATHVLHVKDGYVSLFEITSIPCLYSFMQKHSGVSATDVQSIVSCFRQMEPSFNRESQKKTCQILIKGFDVKHFFKLPKVPLDFARDTSVVIPPGSRVVLFGPNGSGKSVLLQLISGERFYSKLNSGLELFIGERPCFHDTTLVADIAYGGHWWDDAEPEWNLTLKEMLSCQNPRWDSCEYTQYLVSLLEIDVLWRVNKISTGERKRVQLLLRLVPLRQYVLLDEATADLDVALRLKFLVFLQHLSLSRGVTVIYCSHIYEDLMWWGNYALFLEHSPAFIAALSAKYTGSVPESLDGRQPTLCPKSERISGEEGIFYDA